MDTTPFRADYVLCRHHWRLEQVSPDQRSTTARCDYCGIEAVFSGPNLEFTPNAAGAVPPSLGPRKGKR